MHVRKFFKFVYHTINAVTFGGASMTEAELIIDRLYSLMRERNLTVNRLATLANITPSSLSSLIYRKSVPRVDMLHALCSALGITVHDFFDFPPYNEIEK